jgi:hypothetical protein
VQIGGRDPDGVAAANAFIAKCITTERSACWLLLADVVAGPDGLAVPSDQIGKSIHHGRLEPREPDRQPE